MNEARYMSKKIYHQLLYPCLDAHYFCGRNGKSGLSCTTYYYVGCPQPYRMVADLSAFDWMEAFQT